MSALTDAWQAGLAAEQQAAFGYGLLGPQLTGAQHAFAFVCYQAHEAARDATRQGLAAAGQAPVAPLADYPSLYPVRGGAAARRLAVRLEDACAAAWRAAYAQAAATSGALAPGVRTSALTYLTDSAVRAAKWRASIDPRRATTPFPGL